MQNAVRATSGLVIGGILVAVSTELYNSRSQGYPMILMPLMRQFDPEIAHRISIALASVGISPRIRQQYPKLNTTLFGKVVDNPIFLAAGISSVNLGYDKNAEAIDSLFGFGFGGVEVGSITPRPQPGNPKPRLFRLSEDLGVINRFGFNSDGNLAVQERLKARIKRFLKAHPLLEPVLRAAGLNRSLLPNRLLGVNLGKNKLSLADDDSDYINGIKKLGDFADYLVINISSPNTPGLRSLQRREPVQRLLKSAIIARDLISHKPPLLVKIAPDLSSAELEDIASVCKTVGVDGVIISNTTISRPDFLQSSLKSEGGGLSGAPLFELSLATVSKFYQLTDGKITIIGCGGIRTGDDAFRFCKAGASAIQLYTSFAYDGPGIVGNICDRLEVLLNEKKWSDYVGMDHKTKTGGWLW